MSHTVIYIDFICLPPNTICIFEFVMPISALVHLKYLSSRSHYVRHCVKLDLNDKFYKCANLFALYGYHIYHKSIVQSGRI